MMQDIQGGRENRIQLEETINLFIHLSSQYLVKAYYAPDPLLDTLGTMMNRTKFLSLRPSWGKTHKYMGNWSDEPWLIKSLHKDDRSTEQEHLTLSGRSREDSNRRPALN